MEFRTKRIVIVNDGLGPNTGDRAILFSMLDGLRIACPNAQIRTFPNSRMSRVGQYLEFWHALQKADLFIFGGGQEIEDQASVAFLISGLLKMTLAKVLSRPILCYAIGVGPVATGLGRLLVRLVLNRVDLITVRDEDSQKILKQLGVKRPPCFVTADPSFALAQSDDQRVRSVFLSAGLDQTSGPRIAITPRLWFHYRHHLLPITWRVKFHPVPEPKEFTNLKETIAQVADHLVAKHKARVIFVPMSSSGGKCDPSNDDGQVSKEIIDLMKFKDRVFLLPGSYSPMELKAFFGQMDLVIGMRMHSLILASMMNVPIIGMALSPKFHPLFKSLGQSEYLISLKDISYHKLLEKTEAALSKAREITEGLKSRRNTLQELALSNIGYVQHILRSRS